jgi:hypothetical protein
MTQIKFFYNQENEDLFAIFPNDIFRGIFGDKLFSCYSRVGQHSACGTDYVQESRLAKEDEYIPLLNEMIYNYGYKDLEILM